MAAKVGEESLTDLGYNKKFLIFIGGGIAISSIVYLYVRGRNRGNSITQNMEENGPITPQEEEVEHTQKKVLLLGLESSGKSSILLGLQMNSTKVSEPEVAPTPTEGFHVVCVQTGNADLNMWEIGGSEKMRQYWTNFIQDSDILVYVVDSSANEEGLETAREELRKLLEDTRLDEVSLIIVANKQDLPGAKSPTDIRDAMKLTPAMLENRTILEIASQVPFEGETKGLDSLEALLIDDDV